MAGVPKSREEAAPLLAKGRFLCGSLSLSSEVSASAEYFLYALEDRFRQNWRATLFVKLWRPVFTDDSLLRARSS